METKLAFVTKKQAIKLKELGFDSWTNTAIHINGDFLNMPHNNKIEFREDMVAMPTVALAIKWLREKKGLQNMWVEKKFNGDYMNCLEQKRYKTYDKAESAGLNYILQKLTNTKNK